MIEEELRKVVTSWPVIARKQVITALAISDDGTRAFLGIDEGLLEEYELLRVSDGSLQASLTARKPVTTRPILHILPAIASTCLAILTADGALRFVHSDTLESRVMHKGPVLTAAITQPNGRQLPRIAIAHRSGIARTLRISVHEIVSEGGHVPSWRPLWTVDLPPAQGSVCVAWAGDSIVCGVGQRYLLAWPLQQHTSSNTPSAKTTAGSGSFRELLPVSGDEALPLSATSLPSKGCALLLIGEVGLIINAAGDPVGNPLSFQGLPPVAAFAEVGNSGCVAAVAEDSMHVFDSNTGQRVQRIDYGEGLAPAPGQPLRAASGSSSADSSGAALVAGRHRVWALTLLPPTEQARELLKLGRIDEALDLASAAESRGEAWAEEAFAQAALLLLHDAKFDNAAAALDHCSAAAFQPSELFPLFPSHTAPWQPYPQTRPPHWGLHAPLLSLETLVASGLQHEDVGDDAIESAALEQAQHAIVGYLFRARELPGVVHVDGVDTLLMHLLIDLGASHQAGAFAAVPNAVVVANSDKAPVAARLKAAGWLHALATLQAAHGQAEPALDIWRDIVANTLDKTPQREREEALEGAVKLLCSPIACPVGLTVHHLPWLLTHAPGSVVDALASRYDVSSEDILPLLENGSTARWRYLYHLVVTQGSEDSTLHTELATALIAAIIKKNPDLQQAKKYISSDYNVKKHAGQSNGHHHAPPSRSTLSSATLPSSLSVAALVSPTHSTTTLTLPQPTQLVYNADTSSSMDVECIREKLRFHLESSTLWESSIIFSLLDGTALHEESVVARWRHGDHETALRILVKTLRDVTAAVAYTAAFLPPSEHRALLSLVLSPGGGGGDVEVEEAEEEPHWEDAARVVAALGGSLDPLEVVIAMPDAMPLSAAVPLVSPLLCERVARRRATHVAAALHRSQAARGALHRACAQSRGVVVDEGRVCPDCQLRIGAKVFVALPASPTSSVRSADNGNSNEDHAHAVEVVCLNCWNKRNNYVAA